MLTTTRSTKLRVPPLPDQVRSIVAARISREQHVGQEQAEQMLDSTCHFMALAAAFPGHAFVPTKPIDAAWHEFILFTRPYHAYCRLLNRRYIHHVPVDELADNPPKGGALRTRRFMEERGIEFNAEAWQLPVDADCSPDPCTCTGCSEWD
ncbi:MAG: hypothetical protein HY421_02260 [Candidatus Kerfeldbacteria bacterium]|nr:hypothetical protein [Candidatus Kerfeldbacteria bacterium]